MKQLALGALALVSSAGFVTVLAADYPELPQLRPSYPEQWETEENAPLKIQVGVRYWYSIGKQEHSIGADSEIMETKTHAGEAFIRVDDFPTRSYLEGYGGYGIAHEGTYSTNGSAPTSLPAARLGYAGLDFGWLPIGSDQASIGFVTGYQYSNDSPDTGRANFTTAKSAADIAWSDSTGVWTVGADSKINNFDVHALKVGVGGRLDMHGFDVTGEATVTPYAWVNGTYGAAQMSPNGPFGGSIPGAVTSMQSSAVSINGHGYGVGGKLMVGFRPTENLSFRVGGRASYLQGQYDATWTEATVVAPTPNSAPPPNFLPPSMAQQTYIVPNNPFSMLRYGALLEIAGSF